MQNTTRQQWKRSLRSTRVQRIRSLFPPEHPMFKKSKDNESTGCEAQECKGWGRHQTVRPTVCSEPPHDLRHSYAPSILYSPERRQCCHLLRFSNGPTSPMETPNRRTAMCQHPDSASKQNKAPLMVSWSQWLSIHQWSHWSQTEHKTPPSDDSMLPIPIWIRFMSGGAPTVNAKLCCNYMQMAVYIVSPLFDLFWVAVKTYLPLITPFVPGGVLAEYLL